MDIDKLIERANRAFSDRDANRGLLDDCYEYYMPYRNSFRQQGGTFNKPTVQYDSIGMHAANTFVNTMQANFTPVYSRWAMLEAGTGVPEDKRQDLNEALEKITDAVFSYLDASNFHTAISEMFFDWGIGTGCLWLFEGDDGSSPLNFISTPIAQMGLCEGRYGQVDGKYRKRSLKVRHIEPTWSMDKVDLGPVLSDLMRSNPDADVELIDGLTYDYERFDWVYAVVHEASKHTLLTKRFSEDICFTPRWMKIPSSAYGVGPLIMALPDVKTRNKIKELMLRNAALSVFGVYTVASNGTFNPNNINLSPNSFIPVERNGGPEGPSIAPLPRAGDFQVQEFMMQDLENSIKKTTLDTRLPEPSAQPKTAFELSQRIKEFQVDIGSAYGRGMYEFITPLFRRIIRILARRGLIQWPAGLDLDNFFVQVSIVSPVAQAQASEDVQRFMQVYQLVAGINPTLALTAFDVEKLPVWLSEQFGSPARLLRDEAERGQLQQMVAQMVAQQQMAQAGPAQAQPEQMNNM